MIKINSNAREIAGKINMLKKNIPKESKKALAELASIGRQIAWNLAPAKTGNLRAGIHYKVFKNKAEIISMVPKSFPYQFWVNQNIPIIKANFPFFSASQGVVAYGQSGAFAPSGKPIQWTGYKGFFEETANILRGQFGDKFNIAVETAMQKSR